MTYYLAADLGGTKTILQLFQVREQAIVTLKKQRYASAAFSSFSQLLEDFLGTDLQADVACIAIAGPITSSTSNQLAKVTNLPWKIDRNVLIQQFGLRHCKLINDFQAIGYAIPALQPQDYQTLQAGQLQAAGTKAVIGAGTGLGQAIIVPLQEGVTIISTEGGHTDFAPQNPEEIKLLEFLQSRWDHVSWERIVSGPGIRTLYEFLLQNRSKAIADAAALEAADPAANIASLAQSEPASLAGETMRLFTRLYGAQTGNLGLNCLPYGGLYIAGGIAAKNPALIGSDIFLEAFRAKGRMRPLLEKIPLFLITNTELGLNGAVQYAIQLGK